MPQLENKIAIVTGAAQGIGRAVAETYVQEGARVVVADMLADEAAALCEDLNSEHGASNQPVALPVTTDVSDKDSVDEMVARTIEAFGRVDILVNNAALWKALERREFWTIPPEEWDQVFAVNTRGPFLCSAAVTPHMQKQNKGKIICIGSATIWTAQATLTHYVGSKSALIGMVRCMARDLGPYNINVNLVHPGDHRYRRCGPRLSRGTQQAAFHPPGAGAHRSVRCLRVLRQRRQRFRHRPAAQCRWRHRDGVRRSGGIPCHSLRSATAGIL